MTDSWLPIGFKLPDGARCGRVIHAEDQWQLVETPGGGTALVAKEQIFLKWLSSGLLADGDMTRFTFGSDSYLEMSSGASQVIAPVGDCKSPGTKNEALAFAVALRETRAIDRDSPLQDAIYVEKFTRLLPSYGITSKTEDDVVLGYWLTGGARVSVKSYRRLSQMLTWLSAEQLRDILETAGFDVREPTNTSVQIRGDQTVEKIDQTAVGEQESVGRLQQHAKQFELPGRPALEAFFNEHVIDIIQNKERYAALGVGFPAAVILYGPPGCGKTFAVEKLIEVLGWPSFQIDASSVASPYIHETSKKVAHVFEQAMQSAPSVLVIDEMEAFLADRESGRGASHHRVEEVAEFLRRIPEATKNEVLVLAMTNRIEMIDQAILRRGRFDHVIKVDYATREEVQLLLEKLLAALPKDDTVAPEPIAKYLAGRPLSDVAFVVREGARLAARSGASKLGQAFLLESLAKSPSRADDGPGRRIGFV